MLNESASTAMQKSFYSSDLLQHRHLDAMTFRGFDGDLIARVGVADDAHAGIRCQDPLQPDAPLRASHPPR